MNICIKKKFKYINYILMFLLVTFFILAFNNVYARGIQYTAFAREDDGSIVLYFRTFTYAYSGEPSNYTNQMNNQGRTDRVGTNGQYEYNGLKASYWVSKDSKISKAHNNSSSFRAFGIMFHTEEFTNYNTEGKINYGYAKFDVNGNERLQYTSMVENIKDLDRKPINVGSLTSKFDSANVLYTIALGSNYSEGNGYFTEGSLSDIKTKLKGRLEFGSSMFRHALLYANTLNSNIYISDYRLTSNQLEKLCKAIEEKNSSNRIFFSELSESASYSGGNNIYTLTGADFMHKIADRWGSSNRGIGEDAAGSGLNLYDNILTVPEIEKQTLVIKHIDIDTNTTISTQIIKNSPLIVGGTQSTVKQENQTVSKKSPTKGNYAEGVNVYEDAIKYGQNITITSLDITKTRLLSNGKYILGNGYKYIGYNYSKKSTIDDAQNDIKYYESRGSMTTNDGGNDIVIKNTDTSRSNKYIVVNVYYSTYEKDVIAKHVLVNSGKTKVYDILKANKTATLVPGDKLGNNELYSSGTINSISDNEFEEKYKKPLSRTLTIQTDSILDSIKNQYSNIVDKDKINYVGYVDVSGANYQKIIKGTVSIDDKNIKTGTPTVVAGATKKYIVCIYELGIVNVPKSLVQDVTGKLEVKLYDKKENTNKDFINCLGYHSVPSTVNGINSNLQYGITGLPRLLIKGIELEDVSYDNVRIKYNVTYSGKTQTIYGQETNYTLSRVKNIMFSKINNVAIYTPGYGIENTSGKRVLQSSIYNLKDNDFTVKVSQGDFIPEVELKCTYNSNDSKYTVKDTLGNTSIGSTMRDAINKYETSMKEGKTRYPDVITPIVPTIISIDDNRAIKLFNQKVQYIHSR